MKCKDHPKYLGKGKPTSDCCFCWKIYTNKNNKSGNNLDQAKDLLQQRVEKLNVSKSLKEALIRIKQLEAHEQAFESLKGSHSNYTIAPRHSSHKSEATAVAVATDWHIGSEIKPEMVNGLNRFGVAIAKERIKTFFERIVRFTNKERQDIRIDDLVLFLGGDLIEGALHLDTIMTNEIGEPINQAILCQELIEAGLNFLLNHGKYKKITVVCQDGN